MSDITRILERINKLRSLTKSSNPHEAANAAAAADKLIAEYQLSEIDLEIKGQQAEGVEIHKQNPLFESGRVVLWRHELASILCNHYGCTYFVSTGLSQDRMNDPNARRQTVKRLVIVGRKSDADIVRYFYAWLGREIEGFIATFARGKGTAYSQSYARGVVRGIQQQLASQREKTKEAAQQAGQSAAMVIMDNRKEDAEKWMRSNLKLKEGTGSKAQQDHRAFGLGVDKGKNMSLARGLDAGQSNKMLK